MCRCWSSTFSKTGLVFNELTHSAREGMRLGRVPWIS